MAKRKRKKYRSGLEERLHTGPLKNLEYEPKWAEVQYTSTSTYKPDFGNESDRTIIYEAKGRLRDYAEARKYIDIRASNPGLTIRFIITDPNVRAFRQRAMSLGEWLTKYGFEWCTEDNIPAEWRK